VADDQYDPGPPDPYAVLLICVVVAILVSLCWVRFGVLG
jgi:hypothetical protein